MSARCRAVAVLAASLLVAACSAASVSTPSPTASPAATAAVSRNPAAVNVTAFLPAGRYTAVVPEGLEGAPGTWKMTIDEGGIIWTNPLNGTTFSPGDIVELTSSRIVFGPDPGCGGQGPSPTAGTYDWRIDGGKLVFTFVSDTCLGRRDTLTPSPWTPTP